MKRLMVLGVALLLTTMPGCFDDDDAPPADEEEADGTSEESVPEEGNGATTFPVTIERTVGSGMYLVGTVNVPGPGWLQAHFTWYGPPDTMVCSLEQHTGGAAIVSKNISPGAAIEGYSFHAGEWGAYARNLTGQPVKVRVYLTFTPD